MPVPVVLLLRAAAGTDLRPTHRSERNRAARCGMHQQGLDNCPLSRISPMYSPSLFPGSRLRSDRNVRCRIAAYPGDPHPLPDCSLPRRSASVALHPLTNAPTDPSHATMPSPISMRCPPRPSPRCLQPQAASPLLHASPALPTSLNLPAAAAQTPRRRPAAADATRSPR